jgi:predicted dinucleotide-binding enzyme
MTNFENRNAGGNMRIAIIGTGNVGSALAGALQRSHHTIVFGTRSPDPFEANQATIVEATADAEATILAVPFAAVRDVIAVAGGFAGKVLIDATNPLGMGSRGLGLAIGFSTSGAETIAAMAPDAKLFKPSIRRGSRTWPTPLPTRPARSCSLLETMLLRSR